MVDICSTDDSLEAALTLEGFQVSGCHDSKTMTALMAEPFSLVVLHLSHDRSFDAITQLQGHRPTLPIIGIVGDQDRLWEQALGAPLAATIPASRPLQQLVKLIEAQLIRFRERKALVSENRRMKRALEGSRDGLWDWDLESNQVHFSREWRAMLGISPGEKLEEPEDWFKLVHPDDLGALRSRLAIHIEGVTPSFEYQCRMRTHGGPYKWVLTRGMVVRNEAQKAIGITGTLTDLTNRSHHDVRTGLPFRSFFVDRLNQAIVQSQLTPDRFFSVLQVDVDRFTAISEGFGHDMVDALLVAFAQRLETCLGDGDTLAFLGGNSFIIMLEDENSFSTALDVANQIHMQLIAPFRINDTDVFSKASIGISGVDGSINTPNEVLRQAHGAMKAARKLGSGHTHVFDKAVANEIQEYLLIESRLRSALDREEFELHYQPQVHLASGKIIGVEALLRWVDQDGNFISPGKFIPVAEETDLILTIGEWVLRKACQQAMAWKEQGLPFLRVAVNLSERQFRARNLVGMVDQVLKETGLPPEYLELEITESIFMDDAESTFEILRHLRSRGIKIALDDFGTGFSSLSYLKKFPLTTLKIDRTFVTDLTTDAGDAAICSTIISLAHKFNFSVIAEGVETREQLIILRAFQCDEVQGFYYSKALPPKGLEDLIQKQLDASKEKP